MLNKIIQGDCLEVMKDIPDKSIDMILCDLPYGTTACKWDTIIPFEPLWEQYERVIKDNGAIVLTASQPFTSALVMSNPKWFKHEWIWYKNKASNFMGAKYAPLKYHESVLVFSEGSPTYNPQKYKVLEAEEVMRASKQSKKTISNLIKSGAMDRFGLVDRRKTINNPISNKDLVGIEVKRTRKKDDGYRFPHSVIRENSSTKNLHPTQKPAKLFEHLIKTYTNENETVLDNCIGSGTTAVACLNINRNFIGIELEQTYVDIANERIAEK